MRSQSSVLAVIVGVSMCLTSPLAWATGTPEPRVINGTSGSPLAQASVAIETPDGYCTAGLWKSRILITAAHCINDKGAGALGVAPQDLVVFNPGSDKGAGPSQVQVSQIIYNPNWTKTKDDIAFLILNAPLATPIITRMATASEVAALAKKRTSITYVGYGLTGARADENSQTSNLPISVSQPLSSQTDTAGIFELTGDRVHGTCAGDSGGPFMVTVGSELLYLGPLSGGSGPPCEDPSEDSSDEAPIAATHSDFMTAALAAAGEAADPTACAQGTHIDPNCSPGRTWTYSYCWPAKKANLQKKVDGSWLNVGSTTGKKVKSCGRKYPYEIDFAITEVPGSSDFQVILPKQVGLPKGGFDPFTLTVT